jgi:RNA polymerase sigma-70 factor, ECF subfamily
VETALRRRGPPGEYALQAAIAGVHAQAATAAQTDWPQIASLYSLLLRVNPSPVIALNHAVAVAMADGAEAGLVLVERLTSSGALAGYYLLPATRADLLRRLGRYDEARNAYRAARALAGNDADRRFLDQRLEELGELVSHTADDGH